MCGFEPTFGLVKAPILAIGEKRGFAVMRLLTHWPEVVGEELAGSTRPVKIGYGRDGLGATLTVLVSSAHAPMVQMQVPHLIEKVNAVYGYSMISKINLTQTASVGFAEGRVEFVPASKVEKVVDPAVKAVASEMAAAIADTGLRAALEALAQNILTRRKT
ncbi:MAG: DUF721 domain-containing protein [Rhodobacteraceae bacterium]|nr:DUF721 domain-containing protein [Paracoccaceae bacterium]